MNLRCSGQQNMKLTTQLSMFLKVFFCSCTEDIVCDAGILIPQVSTTIDVGLWSSRLCCLIFCTSKPKENSVLTCMFLCRVIPQFMLVGLPLQNLNYTRMPYLTNGTSIDFKPIRPLGDWQIMLNLNRLHSLLFCSKAVTSPWAMAWVERAFMVSITNSSLHVCLPVIKVL